MAALVRPQAHCRPQPAVADLYVRRETIDAVLANVRETEWHVIIALSLYGGRR